MIYARNAESKLQRLLRFYPTVIVTGARQSGKTTMLRNALPDWNYVSLDLPSRAEQAERNPETFLGEHPTPLIIDEVQYAPGLFRHLKRFIDEERHATGRYVLTGSQHFSLMKGITESLAGRVGLLELENLSIQELESELGPHSHRTELVNLMVRGQYPELWRVRDFPSTDFYAGYVSTYLERDVRQILNIASLRDFERFLRILAARSANLLNKSEVAREVGVSVKAVGDWLSVLEASGQIALLEPWFTNISKRVVKTPKVYFRDSGLFCFLLNLTAETLPGSQMLGAAWETFVFAEMRKALGVAEQPADIWFYRDQRAREVDFVVESGGRLSFLEAKWQEHPTDDDARTIRALDRELTESSLPWQPAEHAVLGTPANSYRLASGIQAINLSALRTFLP